MKLNCIPTRRPINIICRIEDDKDSAFGVSGYILYNIPIMCENWAVFRLMIDQAYQRRGYGKAAIKEIITEISQEPDGVEILICYQERNQIARSLYAELGFVEQTIDANGKVTAHLQL